MNRELYIEPEVRKNYLLVIGINKYLDSSIRSLHNARNDAEQVRDLLLQKYQFEASEGCLMELYDEQATRSKILATLRNLANTFYRNPDAYNLVIYFAGHGYWDKVLKMGYLIPADAQKKQEDTFIHNSELKQLLGAIASHHTLLILDCCFAGEVLRDGDFGQKYAENQDAFRSRMALVAGGLEPVSDGWRDDNSPFAKALIDFLARNTATAFTTSDIYHEIKKRVADNADQQPDYGVLVKTGHDRGEFVFRAKISEDQIWQNCQTQGNYDAYLRQFPKGKYALQALQALNNEKEEKAWQKAKEQNTEASYDDYLEVFPKGKYAAEAKKQMKLLAETAAWEKAQKRHSLAAYRDFLDKYPNSDFAKAAKAAIQKLKTPIPEPPKEETPTLPLSVSSQTTTAKDTKNNSPLSVGTQTTVRANNGEISPSLIATFLQQQGKKIGIVVAIVVIGVFVWNNLPTQTENKPQQPITNLTSPTEDTSQKVATLVDKPIKESVSPTSPKKEDAKKDSSKVAKPTTAKTAATSTITPSKALIEAIQTLEKNMVLIKGGTFTMGCTAEQEKDCGDDEKPAHKVTLSDFYIGKYEVTQAEWKAVMGTNPSYFKGDNLPVESVSWNDAQEFIKKLNAMTGKTYKLPSEAQWEYAARGGQSFKYAGSDNLDEVAWYGYEKAGKTTHAVGEKKANGYGLYDMSGNVWEWCQDYYDANFYKNNKNANNPINEIKKSSRVLRGGSWLNGSDNCRTTDRNDNLPAISSGNYGFRVVR